jgi:hypothetical protein
VSARNSLALDVGHVLEYCKTRQVIVYTGIFVPMFVPEILISRDFVAMTTLMPNWQLSLPRVLTFITVSGNVLQQGRKRICKGKPVMCDVKGTQD